MFRRIPVQVQRALEAGPGNAVTVNMDGTTMTLVTNGMQTDPPDPQAEWSALVKFLEREELV